MKKLTVLLAVVLVSIVIISGFACTTENGNNTSGNGDQHTDTTAPIISGITVSNLTTTTATISWTTDESATCKLEYGTTSAYGASKNANTVSTNHSVNLTGLIASTTYHYRVIATDSIGNEAQSGDRVFTTTTAPVVAEAPEIISHSSYIDILGYYNVVGLLENNNEVNLEFVEITATFYNSSGTVIGTDFTYSYIDILTPNQQSPFEITLLNTAQSANVDHYSLAVSDFYETTEEPYDGLAVLSHSSHIDILDCYNVVGEVKNIGAQTATFVEIVGTFYNAAGTIIATDFTFTSPLDLSPGQTAPFELTVLDDTLSAQIVDYDLQVQ